MEKNSTQNLELLLSAYFNLDDECARLIRQGANVNMTITEEDFEELNELVYDFYDYVDDNDVGGNSDEYSGTELLKQGMTPLMALAIGNGPMTSTKTAEVLIQNGANIDFQSDVLRKMNALMVAVHRGNSALVEVLIENDANLNLLNTKGDTAFTTFGGLFKDSYELQNNMSAIDELNIEGKFRCFELLAPHVDVNHMNADGETLLMKIIRATNSFDVQPYQVEFLVDHQINLLIKNNAGQTVIDIMAELKDQMNDELYQYLNGYGVACKENSQLLNEINESNESSLRVEF